MATNSYLFDLFVLTARRATTPTPPRSELARLWKGFQFARLRQRLARTTMARPSLSALQKSRYYRTMVQPHIPSQVGSDSPLTG